MHQLEKSLYKTTNLIFQLQISLFQTQQKVWNILSENIENFAKPKDLTSKEYLKDYERFQTQLIESANGSRKNEIWSTKSEVSL